MNEDSGNLLSLDILAKEIVENRGVALEEFENIDEEFKNSSNHE
jgi:hypothetical protein